MAPLPRALGLPAFPWDTLASARRVAQRHPGGLVDLSVGAPVDSTPSSVRNALAAASDAPGYPHAVGTPALRGAAIRWAARHGLGPIADSGVAPTIGSKEMVAWLPTLLGVRRGERVLIPDVAYPTYDVGARLAGAVPVPVDQSRPDTWPAAALAWINSPSNPTGHVLGPDVLRAAIAWARAHHAVLASDECYAALPWSEPWAHAGVPSLLGADVCGGDTSSLLVLYSLSKQSSMAGYRAGLLLGDPRLVRAIVEVRRHAGMLVPAPVQRAMIAALEDEEAVRAQRARYGARREELAAGIAAAGLENDPLSAAGLYLWVRAPRNGASRPARVAPRGSAPPRSSASWRLVDWFARLGILVAPGDFYARSGARHVRLALTATDERIHEARARLEAAGESLRDA